MNETATVLRRMTSAARSGREPEVAPTGLAMALAKAARDAVGLDARMSEVSALPPSAAEVLEILPEHSLLALLDGPSESLGLCVLNGTLVNALIEMQTIGQLDPATGVPRKPTQIDAALSAGFIDRVLIAHASVNPDGAGYHYSTYLDTPRPLGLLLDAPSYFGLKIGLDIGDGAKSGEILLCLPVLADAGGGSLSEAPEAWQAALTAAVSDTSVTLNAVLHRHYMPLEDALALKPGDMLTIPREALGMVRLTGGGADHLPAARLGQFRGHRALRLSGNEVAGRGARERAFEAMPGLGGATASMTVSRNAVEIAEVDTA